MHVVLAGLALFASVPAGAAEVPAPPPNDDFANAVEVGSVPFTAAAELTLATPQDGEPSCFATAVKSAWYRATVPARTDVRVRITGTGVAPGQLGVYRGASVNALTRVGACSSSMNVALLPGETYYFQVAMQFYDRGSITFSVTPLTGVAGKVTDENGTPLEDICVEAFLTEEDLPGPGYNDYGYAVTDASGEYRIVGIDPGRYRIAYYDCGAEEVYLYEFYDDKHVWEDADLVTVDADALTYGIDAALQKAATITGRVTVEDDGSPAGSCVQAYDATTGWGSGWASVRSDGTYRMHVGEGQHKLLFGCSPRYLEEWYDDAPDRDSATPVTATAAQETPNIDAVLSTRPIPANDDFENAAAIPTLPFDATLDLRRATTQPNEPAPCGTTPDATVWFAYTPAASGIEMVSIPNPNAVPVLGVYTGESLSMLQNVACNHMNARGGGQISFQATAGTTYYIQAGVDSQWGTIGFSVDHAAGVTPMSLSAPTPCLALCPYWQDPPSESQQEREDTCADNPPSPEGSWADHVVTVPETVTAADGHTGAPTHMTLVLAPEVDHDGWICTASGDERFVASSANTTSETCALGPLGCKEQATIPVTPGETFVLRVYNWSDTTADPKAAYAFKVAR